METSKAKSGVPWPRAVSLVFATEEPQQADWAVSVAVGVARKLAGQKKVVLVDAVVRGPSVADKLGIADNEGIVDVLFRGASFATVAQRPSSESFFFLPLGRDVPPPEVIFQHPRWTKIADRLADADAHLLVCVSAEDWLRSGPISGFESCIILNGSGRTVELPRGGRRFAEFLAPPAIRETAVAPEPGDDIADVAADDGELEAEASSSADHTASEPADGDQADVARQPEVTPAGDAAGPDRAPMVLGFSGSKGGAFRTARESSDRRQDFGLTRPGPFGRRIAAAAVVTAIVAVGAVWAVLKTGDGSEEPRVFEAAADTPVAADRVSAPTTEAEPTGTRPRGAHLPYSVAIASYSSFEDALARQKKLTRSDRPVYLAPTPVRGVVYYRVFAGTLAERSEAEALMAQLVSDGVKDTASSWDVRRAGYAFSFGNFATVREAREKLESLLNHGIQAYTVPVLLGAAEDDTAYHVYAGGYETREAAEPLREQIESADLSAELIERVGLLER